MGLISTDKFQHREPGCEFTVPQLGCTASPGGCRVCSTCPLEAFSGHVSVISSPRALTNLLQLWTEAGTEALTGSRAILCFKLHLLTWTQLQGDAAVGVLSTSQLCWAVWIPPKGGIPLGAPGDAEPLQVPRAGFFFSSCHPSPVFEGETELVHFLGLLGRTLGSEADLSMQLMCSAAAKGSVGKAVTPV